MVRFHGLLDALDNRGSQSGNTFELSLTHKLSNVAIERVDGTGSILIGTNLKHTAALFQCQQNTNLFQQISNLSFVHPKPPPNLGYRLIFLQASVPSTISPTAPPLSH